jgi:hypothetical protein
MLSIKLVAVVTATGLVAAAPALASEGPRGSGAPLPNTLEPVGVPRVGQPSPAHRVKPRVLAARLTPRRVVTGRHSRLRVALAGPGRVRVIVERVVHGHRQRVMTRTLAAPLAARIVRLPARLRPGRYRVTSIAIDEHGARSRGARRMLVVVRRWAPATED